MIALLKRVKIVYTVKKMKILQRNIFYIFEKTHTYFLIDFLFIYVHASFIA